MKDMLPAGAVRQKMSLEGFSATDIDTFLAGGEISVPSKMVAPPVSPSFVLPVSTLKPPPVAAEGSRPSAPRKLSLMDELQLGAKLKAVQHDDSRMKSPDKPQGASGSLLDALAAEMFKRRVHVQQDDSDSDASGFSDSDSDDD